MLNYKGNEAYKLLNRNTHSPFFVLQNTHSGSYGKQWMTELIIKSLWAWDICHSRKHIEERLQSQ